MSEQNTNTGFGAFKLPESLQLSIEKLGYITPTPIQESAIPAGLSGRDVVGIAQTGTGKTLAFALPILARLSDGTCRALILAPTRELALQIEDCFLKVGGPLGVKTVVLIGGAPINRQAAQLRRGPNVIIATPGRLLDHMTQRNVHLDKTQVLVFDEADRMMDMGFLPAIKKIVERVPEERQTMLFSATMPNEIAQIAKSYLRDPIRIEVSPAGTPTELVKQELYVVPQRDKGELLEKLLDENNGSILVFARTRHGARKVARSVREMGHAAAELHSDRTLAQRRDALEGFKKGAYRVLVATDIAARGIDVKQISLVVNYDLPDCPEDYVHRIGRTGRAGHIGAAITIATPEQGKDVRIIEKMIGLKLPVLRGEMPPAAAPVRHQGPRRPQAASRPYSQNRFGGSRGKQPARAR